MKELFIFAYIHFQSLKANWALHFFASHNKNKPFVNLSYYKLNEPKLRFYPYLLTYDTYPLSRFFF